MDGNIGTPGFFGGTTVFQQLMISLVVIILLYLVNVSFETMYRYMTLFSNRKTVLISNTFSSTSTLQIPMNPNQNTKNSIHLSDNERSGPEFSYSFFLNINQDTFGNDFGLKHIFHKGYSTQYPLLCPGVYMRNDINTMRIYLNSFQTWNNYCEVTNFPVGKFVHVVLTVSNSNAEVFVNGNLASKLPMDGTTVYQNYQDIFVFSPFTMNLMSSQIPSLNGENLTVLGKADGMISRLKYFNYCLSYTDITDLLNEGPSSTMENQSLGPVPPYLIDTWWTNK